jgi:uncharacterized protein YeaO (DUF488 family)
MIKIQRVYDTPSDPALPCFLVDRLWPRGIKKERLQSCSWIKEAAPSNELRNWYGHDPQRWEEFQRRYFSELDAHPQAWQPLLKAARQGDILLLYSTRETERNNAVALAIYLQARL